MSGDGTVLRGSAVPWGFFCLGRILWALYFSELFRKNMPADWKKQIKTRKKI